MPNDKQKISIGLLIALVGFPQISETIYTPALPSVASSLLTTASMVEMTLAIYFLGFAIGILIWGVISDWVGRRSAMQMGLIVYGIATIGCANATAIEALLIWRLLQAFGASVGSIITQTIVRDAYTGKEQTKIFSVISGALAFSPAIGPLLGGALSEFLGWRANFWVLAILAIMLFLWSFLSLPETRPKNIEHLTIDKFFLLFLNMIKSQALWGHILLISGTNGILFGFYQEAPFIFIEQMGIKPSSYGFFGLLIAAATILAARTSYHQSNRFPPQSIIQCGATCVFLGGLGFMLSALSGIFDVKIFSIALIIATLFLVFFGIGLIIPNSLSQALKSYQAVAGTAGSIFGGFYYLLIAICTYFLSVLHKGGDLLLPLYITFLGLILAFSSQMICLPQHLPQKK